MTTRRLILVVGIGNTLMADDGVGVRAVDAIAREASAGRLELPARVEILDGGTRGLALLPFLADVAGVVFVDALADLRPGEVRILDGAGAIADGSHSALADLVGLADLTGSLPAEVALVGIGAARIDIDTELSPAVSAALPRALEAVLATVTAMEGRLSGSGCVA